MSKEFNIYDPGTWINADEEKFEFLNIKLIDTKTGNYYSQEEIALLINEIITKKNLKFSSEKEFRPFVNEVLGVLFEQTTDYEEAKFNAENGFIPSEMSGVFVAGHELTLAQYTLFQLYSMPEKDQEKAINIYYDGRKNGWNSNRIKQEFFDKRVPCDNYFLIEIMKATLYPVEKEVFLEFLFDWVSESETVEEAEAIFKHEYFEKHPEIKQEILKNNIHFGLENNKVIIREEK